MVKPFQSQEIVPAIEAAIARFTEHRAIEEEAAQAGSVEDKLETRRMVDSAKAILMDSHDLSEMDAFNFIQRSAMDRRVRMQQIAREVLDGTLTP